jgi:hypothetical protein
MSVIDREEGKWAMREKQRKKSLRGILDQAATLSGLMALRQGQELSSSSVPWLS